MAKKGAAKSGDDGARASAQGGGSPWNGKADALRVVAFVGSDAFLREERTRGLIAGIESEHGPVQVMRFDGNTCAIGDVLDECRSMGLLADRKVVVVDEADVLLKSSEDGGGGGGKAQSTKHRAQTEEEEESGDGGDDGEGREPSPRPSPRGRGRQFSRRELMERYVSSPTDGVTLVLRAGTWRPGKIDKLIEQVGAIVRCDELSDREAIAAVVERAKSVLGMTIEREAAALLVDRLGTGMGRLASELEKLQSAAGPGEKTIGVDLVRKLVGRSREEEAWEIQRAILSGNAEQALGTLRDLVEVSRVDFVPLRWSLMDLARKLHAASSVLASRGNEWDAVKAAKMWGRPEDERNRAMLGAAGRKKPGVWAAILSEAVEADWRGKTGRGDEMVSLEVLTLRFARQIGG